MPTGWPVLSLHCSAGFMLSRNSAVVPTMASESPHAVVIAFSASFSVSFESAVCTTTLRHASPPLAFMYFAQAWTPSTEPWNRPGRSGEPVSATTVTVMVVGVTPTSVPWSVVVLHTSEVVAVEPALVVAVGVPMDFPPPHAAAIRTMTSKPPTHPKRLKVPPHSPAARRSDGPSDLQVRACPASDLRRKLSDHARAGRRHARACDLFQLSGRAAPRRSPIA
jgi:hypothetical protein